MATITLAHLRCHAVARSLFTPTTLPRAIARLGFVQADPIRSPARAQDLTLRHRVQGYRVGDLERRYPKLRVEEDFFVNYGFVTPELHALMPDVKSAVVVLFARGDPSVVPAQSLVPGLRGRIARYAQGSDYHLLVKARLSELGRRVAALSGRRIRARPCVDTAPLLERELAARAGLGFQGKSTLLIAPGVGSYVVIGELLLDIELTMQTLSIWSASFGRYWPSSTPSARVRSASTGPCVVLPGFGSSVSRWLIPPRKNR